jgi:esterase/lipase superfamily enzyme
MGRAGESREVTLDFRCGPRLKPGAVRHDGSFFATNRNIVGEGKVKFGNRFHPDGPMFFRVGSAIVDKVSNDVDKGYRVGKVELFDEKLGGSKKGEGVEKLLGSSKLFADLRKNMIAKGKDVIILIHGFANTFDNSLQRAAQIKQAYLVDNKIDPAYEPYIVVFSWPSDGRVQPPWKYHDDRQDAEASGVAIARFMRRFVEFLKEGDGKCPLRIHLVAHSM